MLSVARMSGCDAEFGLVTVAVPCTSLPAGGPSGSASSSTWYWNVALWPSSTVFELAPTTVLWTSQSYSTP